MNEKGCFYGLLVGFVVGITRMIIDFYYKVPTCMEKWTDGDPRPAFVKNVHYMYFALILFWLTITTAVIVSLLTSPLPAKHLVRTTYWTRNDHREIVDEDHFDEAAGIHDNEREQPGIPMEEKNKTETVDQESSSPVEHDYVAPTFRRRYVKPAWDWFCGYDYSPAGELSQAEFRRHLHKLTSLKQDPRAKWFLNVMLVIVLAVALFLFVFFSIHAGGR
ncbi:PREDICTED: sodium/glucose cotransporter 4-like isoform X2 [Priapulus caudatus]|uniref:Sodium/glucose cotransporter 4-like isoform X2 n=1 Tax=Priapulus caudatus TaxID=37621 RepID=A0ABM1ETL0_PRICU|nr:PREDICTED: sodium/glucose cotransporter 4-like isoform X2 [Priapulus caudatus]